MDSKPTNKSNNAANKLKFDDLSMDELKRGVELLVSPGELCERNVLIAILTALEFTPQDVVYQINEDGQPLNAGPVLSLDSLCVNF